MAATRACITALTHAGSTAACAASMQTFALYSAIAVVGAVYLAAVSWATETLTFKSFVALERAGLIRRLLPEVSYEHNLCVPAGRAA